jgi:hypothetical protein
MILQLQALWEKIGLIHHMITFVKDEDNNLGFIATKLRSIIDYEPLKLLRVYESTFFGHAMFKT